MKVIIAGSRGTPGIVVVEQALRDARLYPSDVTEVVSGWECMCIGMDNGPIV